MAKNEREYLETEIKNFKNMIEGLDPKKDQAKINKLNKQVKEFENKIKDLDNKPAKKKDEKISVYDLVLEGKNDKGKPKNIGKVQEIKGGKAICKKINGDSFSIDITAIKKSDIITGIRRHYI